MTILTKAEVKQRLLEAAETLRSLPKERMQGYISSWPDVAPDKNMAYGYNEAGIRRTPQGRQRVSEMAETFRWVTNALQPGYQRKLIWMRAFEMPWKIISFRLEWGERKVRNDYDTFLMLIALHIAAEDKRSATRVPVRLSSGSITSNPSSFARPAASNHKAQL